MFAVVSSGGKQYRVEPGSTVLVDRLAEEPGATITFDRVLLIGDGDETTVGTPLVTGATVSGTVLAEELGPKLVIFKFKQKVKYRRRTGHRQHLTRVRIEEISADGKAKPKARAAKAAPETAETTAEAPAAAEEAKPKARATRSRAAKPKAAEAEASAKAEEAPAKPARRSTARAKKADKTAEE